MKSFVKKLIVAICILTVFMACIAMSKSVNAQMLSADAVVEEMNEEINEEINEETDEQINITNDDSVVSFAKEYLGCEYVWGGAGPYVFDCSGFTQYVMGNFGVDLPHSASRQSEYGTEVDKDGLQPGDLVFFATSGGWSITHVGMYIGDDNFIHAASNGVMINSLSHDYYYRRYVKAVRVMELQK